MRKERKSKKLGRLIWRKCLVCGKRLRIRLATSGKYVGGNFFKVLHVPIEGTGEYKFLHKTRFGRKYYDVAEWTGKKKKVEYWECDACFNRPDDV